MPSRQRDTRIRLRRLFTQGITVLDVAEPFLSFDAARPAVEVQQRMEERLLTVVGVRRDGLIHGFARRAELVDGTLGDHLQPFRPESMVTSDASLPLVFDALRHDRYAFVEILGQVGGIVSRTDVGKPAVRMWLFGMMTIIEGFLGRMLRARWPGESWCQHVSEGRIQKARELQAERARRDEHVELIDCLQLTDKAHALLRDPESLEVLGFASRREGKQAIKAFESLRNNLAHAQDIVATNWETILEIASRMERILARDHEYRDAKLPRR